MTSSLTLLARETAYFEKHKKKLYQEHPNQFVLIHGSELHGAYDSEAEAIDAGYRLFQRGPFLVRKSDEGLPVISNPALSVGAINARV